MPSYNNKYYIHRNKKALEVIKQNRALLQKWNSTYQQEQDNIWLQIFQLEDKLFLDLNV